MMSHIWEWMVLHPLNILAAICLYVVLFVATIVVEMGRIERRVNKVIDTLHEKISECSRISLVINKRRKDDEGS